MSIQITKAVRSAADAGETREAVLKFGGWRNVKCNTLQLRRNFWLLQGYQAGVSHPHLFNDSEVSCYFLQWVTLDEIAQGTHISLTRTNIDEQPNPLRSF